MVRPTRSAALGHGDRARRSGSGRPFAVLTMLPAGSCWCAEVEVREADRARRPSSPRRACRSPRTCPSTATGDLETLGRDHRWRRSHPGRVAAGSATTVSAIGPIVSVARRDHDRRRRQEEVGADARRRATARPRARRPMASGSRGRGPRSGRTGRRGGDGPRRGRPVVGRRPTWRAGHGRSRGRARGPSSPGASGERRELRDGSRNAVRPSSGAVEPRLGGRPPLAAARPAGGLVGLAGLDRRHARGRRPRRHDRHASAPAAPRRLGRRQRRPRTRRRTRRPAGRPTPRGPASPGRRPRSTAASR